MKKRYLISFLLTLWMVISFHQYWFVFKPIDISFNIKGNCDDSISITAQADKKDDNFNKKKEANTEVKLQKNDIQNVNLQIKRSRRTKAFRIVIENIEPKTEFLLTDIIFNGKPVTDLDSFKTKEGNLSIENNVLKIYSKGVILNLNYIGNLENLQSEKKFEFPLLIIIMVLGYLTSLKLTSYLADFKYIENQSRADIIFLGIFFLLLFTPISYISDNDVLEQEKRKAAEFKPLITQNGEINYDFGKNFNDWFNDRFNAREKLINLAHSLSVINKYWETENVLKGKEGWLFYKAENSVPNFQNNDPFTKEELKSLAEYLKSVDDYCKKHNKRFYFFITPAKNRIYGEYFPEKIRKINSDDKSRAVLFRDYLKRNTKIKAIMPNSYIMKKKKRLLYFKSDTHWNGLGAYYAYEVFYNEIKKDFKNLKKTEIEEVESSAMKPGDLNSMLPDRLKVKETTVPKFVVKNRSYQCKAMKGRAQQYCTNEKGNYNAVIYRDSFMAAQIPYFAQGFKTSRFIWKFQVRLDDIENADIVILEATERLLGALRDCKPIEGAK